MIQSKKNKNLISEKTVILDACLLIETLHNEDLFSGFFDFLTIDLESIPVSIIPTYIEFINGLPRDQQVKMGRGSSLDRLQYGVDFLEKMTKKVDLLPETVNIAKMFSCLNALIIASGNYKEWIKKNVPNPSFIDFLIGAMSFHKDIIIATLDHKDFPLYLYDRIYLKTFDLKDEIFVVGFYKVNEVKYNKLIDFASKIIKKTKVPRKK